MAAGAGRSAPASSCDRSRSSAKRCSSASTDARMLATSGVTPGSRTLAGKRGGEKSHRVQRLTQVVARRGKELALREARGLGDGARRERRLGLRLELADEVHVFVAHHERLGDDAVDLASEGKDENQHDAQHAGSEQMHLVALDRHPRDQRHEDRQHKAIERRLVHSGAGQAAEDHAELADDEQRLVGRRRGKHRDGGNAPERARERCAHHPERAPACSIADRRIGARGTRAPTRRARPGWRGSRPATRPSPTTPPAAT